MLDRALDLSGYHAKVEQFKKHNLTSTQKKGIGIAAFLHGAGFTGSGERYLNAVVGLEATAAGGLRVLVSSTEFGQGTNTILCQIAAETLGLEYDDVSMGPIDTSTSPNSGPTVASRTAMIIGRILQTAALKMRQTLIDSGLLEADEWTRAVPGRLPQAYRERFGALQIVRPLEAPPNISGTMRSIAVKPIPRTPGHLRCPGYRRTSTYCVTIEDFGAVQEVGRVLNPVLAAGQIEGGVAQGIGYALYEKVCPKRTDGQQPDDQLHHAHRGRRPAHSGILEEIPFSYGAYGAKGIGELPMDGPAPAILNAILDAFGVTFNAIPLLPEDLFAV